MIDSKQMARRKLALLFFIAAGAMVAAGNARADVVSAPSPSSSLTAQAGSVLVGSASALIERSGLITGSASVIIPVTVGSGGTFSVSLADPAFPTPLAQLSFAATTTSAVLARMSGPGTMSFDVTEAGTYYATVFGATQAPLSLGLYSLRVSFAPVPLPAAVWFMLSALGALATVTQRKRHQLQLV